jgi:hypothetical protein
MLSLKLGNSLNTTLTGYNIYSVDLDGTDEYIDLATSKTLINGQAGSCSVWFTLDNTGGNGTIWQARVNSSNYVNIHYNNSLTQLRFAYRIGGQTKLASHTVDFEGDGQFHHILATWTTSQINLYVDGILVDTVNFSGTFSGTFANSMIGQNTLGGNYLNGKVAHIGLFTTVKAISEVWIAGREPIDLTNLSNLAAYYKLDEGSGTIGFDGGSRNNNANLVNTPTWSSQVPIV